MKIAQKSSYLQLGKAVHYWKRRLSFVWTAEYDADFRLSWRLLNYACFAQFCCRIWSFLLAYFTLDGSNSLNIRCSIVNDCQITPLNITGWSKFWWDAQYLRHLHQHYQQDHQSQVWFIWWDVCLLLQRRKYVFNVLVISFICSISSCISIISNVSRTEGTRRFGAWA